MQTPASFVRILACSTCVVMAVEGCTKPKADTPEAASDAAGPAATAAPGTEAQARVSTAPEGINRFPVVAVWNESGHRGPGVYPYLDAAVWIDGSMLFAPLDTEDAVGLRQGRLSRGRVSALRRGLADSGIFDLAKTEYCAFDLPYKIMVVHVDGRSAKLMWDGRGHTETEGFADFARLWQAVVDRVDAERPDNAAAAGLAEWRPPMAWRIGRPLPPETPKNIDEETIVEIACEVVAANDTWADRAIYEAKRTDGGWSVMVRRIEGYDSAGRPQFVPGGHRIITMDAKGHVTEYFRGA